MSNQKKTQKKYFSDKFGEFQLLGIDEFRKSLERDFFATAEISWTRDIDNGTTDLIVNLECNFDLTEILFHLNNGTWGGFSSENNTIPNFQKSIEKLTEQNKNKVDITELSINLKDTSLIVTKIYPQSILDYLAAILPAISANFVHFTKGLTELPFEIFVPVFIEQTLSMGTSSTSCRKQHSISKGYFDYWGLYFESNIEKDASIYDVRNKSIIDGDFFLLDN